jgi:exodeoxyribonuclease VII large subunit
LEPHVYTVSEIQREVRASLEDTYGSIWVEGEITNWRPSPRGHCYFTLKDEHAQLDAVMWRSDAERLRFEPEGGLKVRARGALSLYEPRGRYQMIVRRLEPAGTGPLQLRFEQLRRRLEAEGLFDPAHKRPLPVYPRRVALITSPSGAAVRDLIHVARRRWPPLELVVVPVRVQGEGAAASIAAGIGAADALGFDVLVVGRGGGSLEDLWAFNEEPVARAIGHEVDVTISDLVADVRAATPSAAAETITPNREDLVQVLAVVRRRLARGLRAKVDGLRRDLDRLAAARPFLRPFDRIRAEDQRLDELADRLAGAMKARVRDLRATADRNAASLEALSPLKVLARGYSVTLGPDGHALLRAADVRPGDELRTILHDGEVRSRVEKPRERR